MFIDLRSCSEVSSSSFREVVESRLLESSREETNEEGSEDIFAYNAFVTIWFTISARITVQARLIAKRQDDNISYISKLSSFK